MTGTVEIFEQQIANFYGAKYAVGVDCCTHAVELCLRLINPTSVTCPAWTYLSIPMTFEKLGLKWNFVDKKWEDYYYIGNTRIIDAAVLWQSNSYIKDTLMCLSFQFQKHLNLIRGGAILTDSYDEYIKLKKMSFDGREPGVPWKQQDITTLGYHYYMTIETAKLGLAKLDQAIAEPNKKQSWQDYPYLPDLTVFKNK